MSSRKLHGPSFGAGMASVVAGSMMAVTLGVNPVVVALIAAGIVVCGTCMWRVRPKSGSNALISRWARRSRRNAGTASWWDLVSTSSGWAMRRRAAVLRPSLRGLPWWRRWRAPLLSYAVPLCRVGRRTVWTSAEESTLRVGIPGTGKTAELACRVIDAPGGVLVTSTASDLYDLTVQLRRERGPVAVFNPGEIGGITSTLRWSPLSGCTDPHTAARRAADLMGPPSESAEGERWATPARRVLAVFLHAAALGGYKLTDVQAWVGNPDMARPTILEALSGSPQAAEMTRAAEQTLALNSRTRDGVMLPIMPALAWVTQPAAAACGDPNPGDVGDVVTDLIDRAGALYLLGDDDGAVAPLIGALTAEITYRARAIASTRPGGRLDPGLTLALDEIALVCPTPLDRWMPELRKRSIAIHAACQGLAQLRQRWGTNGASMILNSAAAVLVFGGCKDADDLALFGQLTGEREEDARTWDSGGSVTSTTTRRVPVIAPAMLAGLANHRVLLVRRGMPVALARTPVAWRRRDVRKALKARPTQRPARVSIAARLRFRKAQVPA